MSPEVGNVLEKFDRDNWEFRSNLLCLRIREGIIKAVPAGVIDVSQQGIHGDSMLRGKLDTAAKELIDRYPESTRRNLKTFLSRVRGNCLFKDSELASVYLYGAPGTGKTFFARTLAKAFDLPLIEISLAGENEVSLFGNDYASWRDPSNTSAQHLVGRIPFEVIRSGVLNPIIYFDEGGDALGDFSKISLLKTLLDPDLKKRKIKHTEGMTIDLSRVTYIISGNQALTDPALKSRLPEIEFHSLPKDAKRREIRQTMLKKIEGHDMLSAGLREKMNGAAHHAIEAIVEEDIRQKSPGLRVAQEVIRDVVAFIRDTVLANEELDENEMKAIISEGFSKRLVS